MIHVLSRVGDNVKHPLWGCGTPQAGQPVTATWSMVTCPKCLEYVKKHGGAHR